MLEFNTELYNRISRSHIGHILTIGNKISIRFYGKILKFEIKSIEPHENTLNFESSFQNMSLEEQKNEFCKVNENTKWNLYR